RRVPDHLIAGGQVGGLDELLTGTFRVSTGKERKTEVVVRFRRTRREAHRLLKIGPGLLVVSGQMCLSPLFGQLQHGWGGAWTDSQRRSQFHFRCTRTGRQPAQQADHHDRAEKSQASVRDVLRKANHSHGFLRFRSSSSKVFLYRTSHSWLPSTIGREYDASRARTTRSVASSCWSSDASTRLISRNACASSPFWRAAGLVFRQARIRCERWLTLSSLSKATLFVASLFVIRKDSEICSRFRITNNV